MHDAQVFINVVDVGHFSFDTDSGGRTHHPETSLTSRGVGIAPFNMTTWGVAGGKTSEVRPSQPGRLTAYVSQIEEGDTIDCILRRLPPAP